MSIFRLVVGVVAGLEILLIVLTLVNNSEALTRTPAITQYLSVFLGMAIAALVVVFIPGKWAPWIAALIACGPLVAAALVIFVLSMLG